jgi:hypothetical protein
VGERLWPTCYQLQPYRNNMTIFGLRLGRPWWWYLLWPIYMLFELMGRFMVGCVHPRPRRYKRRTWRVVTRVSWVDKKGRRHTRTVYK